MNKKRSKKTLKILLQIFAAIKKFIKNTQIIFELAQKLHRYLSDTRKINSFLASLKGEEGKNEYIYIFNGEQINYRN